MHLQHRRCPNNIADAVNLGCVLSRPQLHDVFKPHVSKFGGTAVVAPRKGFGLSSGPGACAFLFFMGGQ